MDEGKSNEKKVKGLNLKLYKKTQQELLQYIKGFLGSQKVKYNVDKYGNIYSIKNFQEPVFVAHADMINETDCKKPLILSNGILRREDGVLGADDRAGVNIILNHCDNINFIITKDEEIGAKGARALSEDESFLDIFELMECTFFIELDRKNGGDIIGAKHGYCTQELSDEIASITGYKDCIGVFTDIDEFDEISQGVNLSVGYYGQHGKTERLVIDEYLYINSKIPELKNIKGHKTKVERKKWSSTYYGYSKYYDSYGYESYGDWGDYTDPYSFYSTGSRYNICEVCSSRIPSNEEHIEVEALDLYICSDCYTVKGEKYILKQNNKEIPKNISTIVNGTRN